MWCANTRRKHRCGLPANQEARNTGLGKGLVWIGYNFHLKVIDADLCCHVARIQFEFILELDILEVVRC